MITTDYIINSFVTYILMSISALMVIWYEERRCGH
jgi:hypothetical protein